MLFIDNIKKTIYLIKSDLFRHTGKIDFSTFIGCYFRTVGFNFMVWQRLSTAFNLNIIKFIHRNKRIKYGIDIPRMKVGEGFYIGHFGGIVVSGQTKIGRNCNISQGVTIGVVNTGPNKGIPIIGNSVYIAPGAKIIGGIKIGDNVSIGANSVVTKDISDNAVVVGVPARVVSYDGSKGYINKIINK